MEESIWELVQACWAQLPGDRPSVDKVLGLASRVIDVNSQVIRLAVMEENTLIWHLIVMSAHERKQLCNIADRVSATKLV